MIQTYLPLPSFRDSIKTLTDDDLRIQCAHVLEIMERFHCIEDSKLPKWYVPQIPEGNEDAPILRMWRGYELQLCEYGLEACEEFQVRTSEPGLYKKLVDHLEWAAGEESDFNKPNWFGEVEFHISHQAALVRHNQKHYGRLFRVDPAQPLEWPVSNYAA